MRRATMSFPPPGAYPTIRCTGRAGYAWVQADREAADIAAVPTIRCTKVRREGFMLSSTRSDAVCNRREPENLCQVISRIARGAGGVVAAAKIGAGRPPPAA